MTRAAALVVVLNEILTVVSAVLILTHFFEKIYLERHRVRRLARRRREPYTMLGNLPLQLHHLHRLVGVSDKYCIEQLRMDRDAFSRLCFLLENVGGLKRTRHVQVAEQVAIYLTVLAHHEKIVVVKHSFFRSGYTVSRHFNLVLKAVIRLHNILLVRPEPIRQECTDLRWKWFKGCLGALDGTYVSVRVRLADKPRYRNRMGHVTVNMLAVCDHAMTYTFLLSGWEGSVADSRVLRDVVSRPSGLKVPNGNYYLADNGYTNGPSFLTPYRGVRYHLKEWGEGNPRPQNYKELFNLRHAKARNVIERSFGVLKNRWAILRSVAFYDIKTQNRIIMACCLLHNFIRNTMLVDPMDAEVPEDYQENPDWPPQTDFVDHVQPTQEWTNWRDELAMDMYNQWVHR